MKLGGIVSSFFMLAGVVVFGIGFYLTSVKDEDSIDRLAEEVKSVRDDFEKERDYSEQFRSEILLVSGKIDRFIEEQSADKRPAPLALPDKIEVTGNDKMTVKFSEPIKVEIVEKPPRLPRKKASKIPNRPKTKK